jgi:hypothetical protein
MSRLITWRLGKTVVYRKEGTEHDSIHLVKGLCLFPIGKQGEYQRIGSMDFGRDEAKLFEDGLEVQRGRAEQAGVKAHPPTQSPAIYEAKQLGVFTII